MFFLDCAGIQLPAVLSLIPVYLRSLAIRQQKLKRNVLLVRFSLGHYRTVEFQLHPHNATPWICPWWFYAVPGAAGMTSIHATLTKTYVQYLVHQAAKDGEEETHLLRLVETEPTLWEGLKKDEVVRVLRAELQDIGMTAAWIERRCSCRHCQCSYSFSGKAAESWWVCTLTIFRHVPVVCDPRL